jgi:hypothetical protein
MSRDIENFQPVNNLLQLRLCCSLATFLCLIFACSSVAPAQSRRKPDDPKPAPTIDHDARNNRTSAQLTFLIVTPTPPPPAENQPQTPDYSHQIRGACMSELGRVRGVRSMEDEDISSREARDLAQIETDTYVVWMELKWVGTTQYSQTPFRLRYLLLEPGSGKTLASGYGTPTLWVWGLPNKKYSLEEQIDGASRNVAAKVIAELGIKF